MATRVRLRAASTRTVFAISVRDRDETEQGVRQHTRTQKRKRERERERDTGTRPDAARCGRQEALPLPLSSANKLEGRSLGLPPSEPFCSGHGYITKGGE